ncbi:MAG TPA: hypothetical protein VFY92_07740 [Hyphomicrobiaceae bacterium]|nr:hypothetical protein [Hyphomicrobiaceae bacterium]
MQKTVADQYADALAAAGSKRTYKIVRARWGKALPPASPAAALSIDALVNRTRLTMPPFPALDMAKGFIFCMANVVITGRGDEVIHLARSNLSR